MAHGTSRRSPELQALEDELNRYLKEINRNKKNLIKYRLREQNNLHLWIQKLSHHPESLSLRDKAIRNEYARRLNHLLRHGQIEHPFSSPPPSQDQLSPLQQLLAPPKERRKSLDDVLPKSSSSDFLNLSWPLFSTSLNNDTLSPLESDTILKKEYSIPKYVSEKPDLSDREPSCDSCDGHQFIQEKQHIKLSPQQKKKLYYIQEEQKKIKEASRLNDPSVSNADHERNNSNVSKVETRQRKSASEVSVLSDGIKNPFIINSVFFNSSTSIPDFNKPSQEHGRENRKNRFSGIRSGGQSDLGEFQVMNSTESPQSCASDLDTSGVEGGLLSEERKSREDRKVPHPFEEINDDDVKSCISCGRFMGRPEIPPACTDFNQSFWRRESLASLASNSNVKQTQRLEPSVHSSAHNSKYENQDKIEQLLDLMDREGATLKDFLITMLPLLPDKGEVVKNVTGEEFFRFIQYVDSIFAVKFDQIFKIFCSQRHATIKEYVEQEKKLKEMRAYNESGVRAILPNFDVEEFVKDEDYVMKALTKSGFDISSLNDIFNNVRRSHHAELQSIKNNLDKLRKDNENLKNLIESYGKNTEKTSFRDEEEISILLHKFKVMLQSATEFHQLIDKNMNHLIDLRVKKSLSSSGK